MPKKTTENTKGRRDELKGLLAGQETKKKYREKKDIVLSFKVQKEVQDDLNNLMEEVNKELNITISKASFLELLIKDAIKKGSTEFVKLITKK